MTEPLPRLFLIDGSSLIFRAFFAFPPLINSNGLPTNAIFGFTNLLLKFLKQHRPEYVAVALDASRQTFRKDLFLDYKANRREPPADLIPQLPYFRRVLGALRLPLFEMPGYEADDVIATLCRVLKDRSCEVVVVSSDKDLMQLVTEGVKLLDGARDHWIGLPEIQSKFGVEPDKIVEVMGLMGDPVDNIPGVKGIGEKSAMALIQRFDTLEELYGRLDEVDKMPLRGAARLRKLLESGQEAAILSRALATLNRHVPLAVCLEQLRVVGFDHEEIRVLFTELEFTNLIKLFENGRL